MSKNHSKQSLTADLVHVPIESRGRATPYLKRTEMVFSCILYIFASIYHSLPDD